VIVEKMETGIISVSKAIREKLRIGIRFAEKVKRKTKKE
jgi:hypothetical protein